MPLSVVYDVVVAIAAAGSLAVTIPPSEADLSLAMFFGLKGMPAFHTCNCTCILPPLLQNRRSDQESIQIWSHLFKNRRSRKWSHFCKIISKISFFMAACQLTLWVALPEKMNGPSESNPCKRMKCWAHFCRQSFCRTEVRQYLVHDEKQWSVGPLVFLHSDYCTFD